MSSGYYTPLEGQGQPPVYNYPNYQPTSQQQQNVNTNVVVANQPQQLPPVSVVQPRSSSQPYTLIFSVVLAVVMGMQLFIPAFVCLLPGIILAVLGYTMSDSKEDRHTVKALNGASLCCNVSGLIFYLTIVVGTISVCFYVYTHRYNYYRYYYY